MTQTVVDISKLKDRDTAAAIDNLATSFAAANIQAGGAISSVVAGTAAAELTLSRVAANVNGVVASGTDTNISVLIDGAGTGRVALGGLSGTAIADAAVQIVPTASSVDFVQITGGATGSPGVVTIAAAGTDTDIDLALTPKGAGAIKIGLAMTANGSVATTMTSLGPTGSHTTIQEWWAIKNSSGTVRYIPLY